MKSKRILSAALALAMLAAGVGAPSGVIIGRGSDIAASAETYGDFEYTVLADGTAQITNYLGTDSEIVVPAEIDKIKVTGFSGISFFGIPSDAEKLRLSKVKKVTLSDGITFLGSGSFYGNDAIEEIVLPDSITSLGDFVFDGELDTSNSFNREHRLGVFSRL